MHGQVSIGPVWQCGNEFSALVQGRACGDEAREEFGDEFEDRFSSDAVLLAKRHALCGQLNPGGDEEVAHQLHCAARARVVPAVQNPLPYRLQQRLLLCSREKRMILETFSIVCLTEAAGHAVRRPSSQNCPRPENKKGKLIQPNNKWSTNTESNCWEQSDHCLTM